MLALDTNILVRYFVRDDEDQARKAMQLIQQRLSADQPTYICDAVLLELCWVLERTYRWSNSQIADVLITLLSNEVFVLQNEAEAHIAYVALSTGQGSFSDAFISAIARTANCSTIYTFDRKALRLPGFEHL